MFLQRFNSTDLQRNVADIWKAVYKKPVIITRQSRLNKKTEDVVMISLKQYKKLIASSSEA